MRPDPHRPAQHRAQLAVKIVAGLGFALTMAGLLAPYEVGVPPLASQNVALMIVGAVLIQSAYVVGLTLWALRGWRSWRARRRERIKA